MRKLVRICVDAYQLETVNKQFYLRQNFLDGWERSGAALSIFHEGKPVVDIWGGYADVETLRKWEEVRILVENSYLLK